MIERERGGLTFPGTRRMREVPSLLEQSGYGSTTLTLSYGPPLRSQTTLGGGVWEQGGGHYKHCSEAYNIFEFEGMVRIKSKETRCSGSLDGVHTHMYMYKPNLLVHTQPLFLKNKATNVIM